jgi:hypothetical protein
MALVLARRQAAPRSRGPGGALGFRGKGSCQAECAQEWSSGGRSSTSRRGRRQLSGSERLFVFGSVRSARPTPQRAARSVLPSRCLRSLPRIVVATVAPARLHPRTSRHRNRRDRYRSCATACAVRDVSSGLRTARRDIVRPRLEIAGFPRVRKSIPRRTPEIDSVGRP